MLVDGCLACDVLAGKVTPPGGVIYDDQYWRVDHSTSPIVLPGFLIIKPRRHVEHIALLTAEEMAAFGPLLRNTCRALAHVLHPAKIYATSFGEAVAHVHWYVLPRMPDMPANGIEVLSRLFGEKPWAGSDEEAAAIADQVRPLLTEMMRQDIARGMERQ
ncbi:MAG TPA: HIT domain-containing protein [Ktedonobacterales bacterium]|jgi:diadenosine tetraphosphate (Ap4A) HIT family hydrolase